MKLMFCIFQEMFEFYQTISNVDEELRQKTDQSSELEFKRQIDSPRSSWGKVSKVQSWNSSVKLIPWYGPGERF